MFDLDREWEEEHDRMVAEVSRDRRYGVYINVFVFVCALLNVFLYFVHGNRWSILAAAICFAVVLQGLLLWRKQTDFLRK